MEAMQAYHLPAVFDWLSMVMIDSFIHMFVSTVYVVVWRTLKVFTKWDQKLSIMYEQQKSQKEAPGYPVLR
jgi:hypothetical protein